MAAQPLIAPRLLSADFARLAGSAVCGADDPAKPIAALRAQVTAAGRG